MSLAKRLLELRTNRQPRGSKAKWEGPFDIEIREESATNRYTRTRDTASVNAFNNEIKTWGAKVKSQLYPSIASNEIKGTKLKSSIKNTYKEDYGEIFRIGFSFKPEGVYVHKGVGRGYVMQGGVVVKTSRTEGWNRRPKPWFNPVIEANMPELQEIIKRHVSDAVINTARIYIQ